MSSPTLARIVKAFVQSREEEAMHVHHGSGAAVASTRRSRIARRPGSPRRPRKHRLTVLAVAGAVLMGGMASLAGAQTAPPPEKERPSETQPALDAAPGGDPTSPVAVLPPLIEELEGLAERAAASRDPGRGTNVRQAARFAEQALGEYTDGSTDLDAVVRELGKAGRHLQRQRQGGDGDTRRLRAIAVSLVGAAKTLAANVVDLAAGAGLDTRSLEAARASIAAGDTRLAEGDYAGAAEAYGDGLSIASAGLHFDLDRFEQEIRDRIGPFVIGYAYTINTGGNLARSDGEGDARTAADPPQTSQSPGKEMHLASVSKTITGVAMLRALQDKGISVESSIEPYLPQTWSRGDGVENLTFRHLFNHRSGFAGNQGNAYSDLRTRIGQAFPTLPGGFVYSNANFALMRILLPRVVASSQDVFILDFADLTFQGPSTYAAFFETYVRNTILKPIGIDGRCRSSDPADTREYNWPADNQPGYQEEDWTPECGGFGWFLSSNEMGAFMAHLRYTSTLLKPPARAEMDQLFLGWLDPTRFGWSTGVFGTYHNHGGDWRHAPVKPTPA